VAGVVVAHPDQVKLTAASLVKTDQRATFALARLLAANLVPAVWVPPVAVRELRALIAPRQRLVAPQPAAQNRLPSLLHRPHIVPPAGKLFSAAHRTWWQNLALDSSQKLRLGQDLASLDPLAPRSDEVEVELARQRVTAAWADQGPWLTHLPGLGLLRALTRLSASGDIQRCPTAKKLVGYAGRGARIPACGQTHRAGGSTKQGRRELRLARVEAAWIAVQTDPHWQARCEQLTARLERQQASVAIARKLLVGVWHGLTAQVADRQAAADKVAGKLRVWSWDRDDDRRGGLKTRQFSRYHLLRLGLGHDLRHIEPGGAKRLIAPAAEVLALRPELQPAT